MEHEASLKQAVCELLAQVCPSEQALRPGTDLLESGALDSLALIQLLEGLEDMGYEISPTQVDRNAFRTPEGITALCLALE